MILRNVYTMILNIDDADYKWCRKKGCWCPKDEFNWMCGSCCRR